MTISLQVLSLFIIALPIASVAWTITHEEVLREFPEYCQSRSENCQRIYQRKFFYLFICVTAFFLVITRYKLLFADWRGYLLSFFSLVFVANLYMSIFGRLRLVIKKERVEIAEQEGKLPQND